MDDRNREHRRQLWQGTDSGWSMTVELITAVGVWMGIGWFLDRWLETAPWLMSAGAFLGFALGTYLAFMRYQEQAREEEAKRPRL